MSPREQKSLLTFVSVTWVVLMVSYWLGVMGLPLVLILTWVPLIAGFGRAIKNRADQTGKANEALDHVQQNRDAINDDVAEWLISTLDMRGEYDYQYLRDELATSTVWTFDQEVHRKGHSTTRALLQGTIHWDRAGGPVTLQVPWLIIASVRERDDGNKYRDLEAKPDFDRATVKTRNDRKATELTENKENSQSV